ncbi:hypothetical protein NPIL_619051, partial [Nephila pilipes]
MSKQNFGKIYDPKRDENARGTSAKHEVIRQPHYLGFLSTSSVMRDVAR